MARPFDQNIDPDSEPISEQESHGYQSLMNSLISPTPGGPIQGNFEWPGQRRWEVPTGTQTPSFGYEMPFPQAPIMQLPNFTQHLPQNHESSNSNGNGDQYDPNGYSVHSGMQLMDRDHDTGIGHSPEEPIQTPAETVSLNIQQPSASAQLSQEDDRPAAPKKHTGPTESDAQRLASLRAKLQAQKAERSGSTTPAHMQSRNAAKKSKNAVQSEANMKTSQTAEDRDGLSSLASTGAPAPRTMMNTTSIIEHGLKPGGQTSGMSADIDNLLAEVRNGAEGKAEASNVSSNGLPDAAVMKPSLPIIGKNANMPPLSEALKKEDIHKEAISSSDEEGEISDEPATDAPPRTSNKPVKSTESRQDTMTETQEKFDRQQETQKVYQPLVNAFSKTTESSMDSSCKKPLTPFAGAAPVSGTLRPVKGKPALSSISKHSVYPMREEAPRGYDSYKPMQDIRRNSTMDIASSVFRGGDRSVRRNSFTTNQMQAMQNLTPTEIEATQRANSDLDERIAVEHRKTLAAKDDDHAAAADVKSDRCSSLQSVKQHKSTNNHAGHVTGSVEGKRPLAFGDRNEQFQTVTPMADVEELSTTQNPDIRDWLELTEYHDIDFRERKLQRFRRVRELEAQKAELEREDLIEAEARSVARAKSILSPPRSSSAPRSSLLNHVMAPPPKPEPPGPVVHSNGTAAEHQSSPLIPTHTPTLKRQFAEADTDYKPVGKIPRLEQNGSRTRPTSPSSASSIKGEKNSVRQDFGYYPPESRVNYGDEPPRGPLRGRTRSPPYDLYRPRSPMDRRRYVSKSPDRTVAPNRSRGPSNYRCCFNCGEPNHHQNVCPYPRRDSKDGRGGRPHAVSKNQSKDPVTHPAQLYDDRDLANGRRASDNAKFVNERGRDAAKGYN